MIPAASVVIPVLNDAAALRRLIADLRVDASLQIVVVDGRSGDASLCAAADADRVLSVAPSRGRQLRAGASCATSDWLWFLHADSRISPSALAAFANARAGARKEAGWGWFDVRLTTGTDVSGAGSADRAAWPFRMIATAMNWRSALTGIATGDQGIFVHRQLLQAAGGVPPLPLMEDVTLCRRLRRLAKPRRLRAVVETSARRWQRDGIARTVATMWALRLRYFFGADAERLACLYYRRDG